MSYTIDAKGRILGRIASEAAMLLRGKHTPAFLPHTQPETKLVITNAAHIRLSGNKRYIKIYKHYSGYPGGLKEISFEKVFKEHPERVLEHAIRGMLPNNKLRKQMMKNLTIHHENP